MIADDIKKIPAGARISLIIRHAERDAITNMEDAFSALLTEKGKREACQLGRELALLGPAGISHSPVERCRETAVEIHRGLKEKSAETCIIGHSLELGGPYVVGDWKDIAQEIMRYGYDTFLRMWINGRFPESLVLPAAETARIIAGLLFRQIMEAPHASINVTHDWNLLVLREHFFGLCHEDLGIPPYLDGILFYASGGIFRALYQGREQVILHPFN